MPTIVTGGNTRQQSTSTNDTSAKTGNENLNVGQEASTAGTSTAQQGVAAGAANTFATPTIVNDQVPIVVFVGPPSSGKSMILVRLAKYLRNEGYTVKTDPTFLNTAQYQNDCQEFAEKLNTVEALPGSEKFLLVHVYKDGREIAKLLEAPGEDFYTTDPEQIRLGKNRRVEPYLSAIMTSRNPKSYIVLLDLDSPISFRNDTMHRDSYAQRFLTYFYPAIDQNRDRIVLLYNKIDTTMFGTIHGCTDPQGARKDAELYYRQLFASMRITRLGGFITSDNFAFKTFCTGMFTRQVDNAGNEHEIYNVAADVYPRDLWREITKRW